MALLITLAVIGGLTGLVALYILGTYLSAAVIGHTALFKEKIDAVIDNYRARRNAKRASKKEEPKQECKDIEVKEPEVKTIQE